MEELKFKRYGKDGYIKFDINQCGDYIEEIEKLGYKNKIEFLSAYHCNDYGETFLELTSYRHNDNDTCICSLWDYKNELFEFYCEDKKEEFSCVKELIEMSILLTKNQHYLKILNQEENEKRR